MKRPGVFSRGDDADVPSDPEEAAAYWSARRHLGTMTPADTEAFEIWLADPAHRAAFNSAEDLIDSLSVFASQPKIRHMRDAALAAGPDHVLRHRMPFLRTAAAIAVVGVFATAIGVFLSGSDRERAWPATAQRYATKTGEHVDVTLDDGSLLSLDTASVVEVAFSPTSRDVHLIHGQAFFKVAKDRHRPFVVAAGDRTVTALGTEFDVTAESDRVDVVLVEGHVAVDPLRRTGLARLLPRLARYDLQPGDHLLAAPGGSIQVSNIDTARATSWRTGQLVFRNDTVATAIAEMNRYSTVQLQIDDPSVANLTISGVFSTARPENFVAALTARYPITAEKRSSTVTALVRRKP